MTTIRLLFAIGIVSVVSSQSVVPKPQWMVQSSRQLHLDSRSFGFSYLPGSVVNDVLTNAFNRYYKIIFKPTEYDPINLARQRVKRTRPGKLSHVPKDAPTLNRVLVKVMNECDAYPNLESDESYTLMIAGNFASIDSNEIWGALRGILM